MNGNSPIGGEINPVALRTQRMISFASPSTDLKELGIMCSANMRNILCAVKSFVQVKNNSIPCNSYLQRDHFTNSHNCNNSKIRTGYELNVFLFWIKYVPFQDLYKTDFVQMKEFLWSLLQSLVGYPFCLVSSWWWSLPWSVGDMTPSLKTQCQIL